MKKIITLIGLAFSLTTNAQIITTIAGNGTSGGSGDGGQATAAELNYANSVAVDGMGNVYISDENNNVIRKVNTAGIINVFVGGGTSGLGDGGQATDAQLADPLGIAFDAMGNIYIADQGNQRIRKVNTAGIISTIAGNGTSGYSGDGGQATDAELSNPSSLAIDAMSNVYITDGQNMVIRVVNTAGIISTFAGTYSNFGMGGYSGDGGQATAAQLNQPACLAIDAVGNVYIADAMNQCIRIVNTAGIINTFSGNGTAGYTGDGGQATAATLSFPYGIAFDAMGNLYITNDGNTAEVIRMVNTAGIISTFAGNGTQGYSGDGGLATAAQFNAPFGITFDDTGNMYVADFLNNVIRFISAPAVVNVNAPALCIGNTSTLTANGATTYTWSPAATLSATTGSMVVASPTLTTTYTVNATNNFTICNVPQTSFGMDTARVTVNSLPTLTVTATAGFSVCPNTVDTLKASGTATSYTWNTTHAVTNYTVHPFNTTTYTLTGIDANGCKNTMTQPITVYPRPTLTITPSSGPICAGSPTTLSTTTGTVAVTSYSWSTSATTSSITVSPVLTSTYSVIGTSAQGCSTTKHYTLTVNQLPTITATTNTTTICIGGTASLTAHGASTYTWSTGATSSTLPVTLTVTTTYTIEGTKNGCENMTTITQSVSTTCYADIAQYNSNNGVSVYPNPNNGNFVVTTAENTNTILVTDILGNELVSINPNGNTTTNINLSAQPSGVYFIKVIANDAQTVKRIIINN